MSYKSSVTWPIKVGLVIIFVGLLVFPTVSTHSQEELLAFKEEPSLAHRQPDEAGKPNFTQILSPQAQLAAEVDKVADTLKAMEKALALQRPVRQELVRLVKSLRAINKLDGEIVQDFENVRSHCEQAGLPSVVLNRCELALQNYRKTEQIIVDAIEVVLRGKALAKPGAQKDTCAKADGLKQTNLAQGRDEDSLTLLDRVKQSREVLAALKLRAKPDLHNSQPSTWELLRAGEVHKVSFDPNAPSVNVMAEASAEPPLPEDLFETLDVQITDEIVAEANELGNTPSAIYEFARNECEFQPYYGSRKGSVETLRQRSGNDYDLTSLTIALLRASGIEARYATGIVEMPVERAKSWLGVDDGSVAGSILTTMGLEGVTIVDVNSNPVAVRCRRVWVEAYVSRGRGGKVWVPLDPPGLQTP